MNIDINELKSLYIFEGLEQDTIVSILNNSKIRNHKEGEVICREGDDDNNEAYIIFSGEVSVYIEGKFIRKLGKGDIFGEYAPIREEKRSATVIADSDVVCIVLNEESILKMASDDIKLNKIMISRINENIEKNLGIFKEEE